MKEIMAFLRVNKVNATKTALAENGFPAFTCRPVLGRGKAAADPSLLRIVISEGELPMDSVGESISYAGCFFAKRFFTLIVWD